MSKLKVTTEVPNEIHMTRTFDAPRRLVVQAMTTPDLIKRWLGGVRATVISAEVDLRVGGKYRYVFRKPDGASFGFGGVFRELSDDRAVQTEAFDGYPGESVAWLPAQARATTSSRTFSPAWPRTFPRASRARSRHRSCDRVDSS